MGKSAILAVRIIGDATGAVKAMRETETALDKIAPAAAVAGGASAAALGAGFFDAVNVEAGLSKVSGQLNLTKDESARIGTVSAELFANGWGSGADQINEALSSVVGNIDGMRSATDEQLSGVSQGVLTVANTFDQDLGGVTTAVGQMMRTGMAKDATEALDIITRGLQGNSRAGEDLLDTFTEYPALFERLGLDGQTATGLIEQGLNAGARSTDLVADALKEFQIRATDGSTASAEGFRALGLDAEAMTAQIAAGGDGAAAGLDQVLDSLRGMQDPVERNAAAVALFGTQAEDLGGALFALDPSAATSALGDVAGAATELGETMSDNAATKITEFQRKVQTSFQEIGAKLIPVIEPVLDVLTEFAPILGPLAVAIAGVSGAVLVINGAMKAYAAVQAIATAAQWASNAAWLASPITWIVLAVIAAIAILIGIIVLVVQNWDTIAAKAAEVWAAVIAWIQTAIGWLRDQFNAVVAGAAAIWQNILDGAAAVWQGVIGWIQTAIEWVQNRVRAAVLAGALAFLAIRDRAAEAIQGAINWVHQIIGLVRDGISNAIQGAVNWFTSFRDGAVNALKGIIQWVRDLASWLADIAMNAIPGWAQELLGMSSMSATMTLTPEVAAFSAPLYTARMAVTPDAMAAPMTTLDAQTENVTARIASLPSASAMSTAGPSTTVQDNRRIEINLPNYMGDKDEIIHVIREALADDRVSSEGLMRV